jgi:rhodanese-related sulfurtransferase
MIIGVYSKAGTRSAVAKKKLQDLGYHFVYNLGGYNDVKDLPVADRSN